MVTTATAQLTAPDGGAFDAFIAVPEHGSGPGVLVIQEIFGVNAYIREVCERLAVAGFVALAPDVYWRLGPGTEFDSSDPASLGPAMEVTGRWDADVGLGDLGAALDQLGARPDVRGGCGVMGFCFGGTQTFRIAAAFDPVCAVSYYGSGVAGLLDDVDSITCPTLFHFGGDDPYLPLADAEAVVAAAADRDHLTARIHAGAGHAFDNHFAPHFSQPATAVRAWSETLAFLFTHLGAPGAQA